VPEAWMRGSYPRRDVRPGAVWSWPQAGRGMLHGPQNLIPDLRLL